MRRIITLTFGILVATSLFWPVASRLGAEAQLVNRSRNLIAIDGYDPVAYFLQSAPIKGQTTFEYQWNGTRYLFSSAANRERFATDPAAYAPQYGGFCAYAVSRGYTADIDPDAWTIVGGRLYLNYSKRVQRLWQEDVAGNIRKADANWPRLRDR
jgi:YHS domain-containing protein